MGARYRDPVVGGSSEPQAGWGRAIPPLGALVAAAVATVTTRHGLLYDPDSASYLRTARLLRTHPLRVVSIPRSDDLALGGHYPPGYPWLLGQAGHVGSLLGAGRWLGVVAAFLATLLLGMLVARHARPATTAAFLAVVIVMRGYVGRLFGFVMADGVSLVATLLAIVLLDAGLDVDPARHGRRRTLLLGGAAAAAGVACSTRLVDLAVVLTVAAAVAVFERVHRDGRTTMALAIGLVGPVAWVVLQPTAPGPQQRARGWYPPLWGDVTDLLHTTALSWLPDQVVTGPASGAVAVLTAAVLLAAAAWSARFLVGVVRARADVDRRDRLTAILVGFGWSHLALLVASRLFVDPWIVFEARHLLPSLVAGLAVVALRWDGIRLSRASLLGAGVLVLAAALPFARSVRDLSGAYENVARRSGSSPLTAEVRRLPRSTRIYADRNDIVYLLTGRRASSVPAFHDEKTGKVHPHFARDARAIARDVQRHHGVVVIYEDDPSPTSTRAELQRVTRLEAVHHDDDGSILACPEEGACDRPSA